MESYAIYKRSPLAKLNKREYSKILGQFNAMVVEHILLEGLTFQLGFNLGNLLIQRREPVRQPINWPASNALKAELIAEGKKLWDKKTGTGEKWLVYRDEKWLLGYYWERHFCRVKNKRFYRYKATRGDNTEAQGALTVTGMSTRLGRILKNDDLAYLKFKRYDPLAER
jgi:hypothetical protein